MQGGGWSRGSEMGGREEKGKGGREDGRRRLKKGGNIGLPPTPSKSKGRRLKIEAGEHLQPCT